MTEETPETGESGLVGEQSSSKAGNRPCASTNKDGKPCRATPLAGSPFCLFHSKGEAQRRIMELAHRAGGLSRLTSLRPVVGIRMALGTPAGVSEMLEDVAKAVAEGQLDRGRAQVLTQLGTATLKALTEAAQPGIVDQVRQEVLSAVRGVVPQERWGELQARLGDVGGDLALLTPEEQRRRILAQLTAPERAAIYVEVLNDLDDVVGRFLRHYGGGTHNLRETMEALVEAAERGEPAPVVFADPPALPQPTPEAFTSPETGADAEGTPTSPSDGSAGSQEAERELAQLLHRPDPAPLGLRREPGEGPVELPRAPRDDDRFFQREEGMGR